MLDVHAKPSQDFPDDPMKWDGWRKYNAENPYERLCLDPRAKPRDEQIQQHCASLLQWWQRKLPLKNQPSNPMAQLLWRGLDEASRYLVEGRMQLLDPVRRLEIDAQLAARAEEEALAEFSKYVAFSITGKVLTAEAEANLTEFAQHNGLTEEQTRGCIEEELQRNKAHRAALASPPAPESTPFSGTSAEAEDEFHRILGLSKLDLADATWLVRRIFVTMAENLGISLERAEHLLDDYLDEDGANSHAYSAPSGDPGSQTRIAGVIPAPSAKISLSTPRVQTVVDKTAAPTRAPAEFLNPVGAPMVLIPAGEFVMGSNAPDAAPNEQPLTPVTLSQFYMARRPVTNAEYEKFDPSHKQNRMKGAGGDHPVVYVTSLEAVKYCEWLRQKDGKNYRLPTEAEWEYAARGTDGRKYPWGNHERRGDVGNFADASTTFPWRDPQISDGHPETSPVGAFPRGASVFGLDDMAGNVWEWCLDFYLSLAGTPKRNPRGGTSGSKRVYRGGSWKSRFSNLRTTARSSNAPNFSCNDVGFRVACGGGGDLNGG